MGSRNIQYRAVAASGRRRFKPSFARLQSRGRKQLTETTRQQSTPTRTPSQDPIVSSAEGARSRSAHPNVSLWLDPSSLAGEELEYQADLEDFASDDETFKLSQGDESDSYEERALEGEYNRLVSYRRVRPSILKRHKIFIRGEAIDVPDDVAEVINRIHEKRLYPPPSEREINRIGEPKYGAPWGDENDPEAKDFAMGPPLGKSDVRDVFAETLFATALELGSGRFAHYVSKHKGYSPTAWELGMEGIPDPTPSMLFGSSAQLFGKQDYPAIERSQAQTIEEVRYPFLVAEIGWPLWVMEHQCIMGCASCSDMVEKLQDQMQPGRTGQEKPSETIAFGFVSNGTEARLYISWCEHSPEAGTVFEVREIENFLVQTEYPRMRMSIFNVFEWAEERERRLSGILDDIYPTSEDSPIGDFGRLEIHDD
ncbi:hypothetical protein Hte_011405 [Hypoxylon texense]